MATPTEEKFIDECEARGYKCLNSGHPDFLVIPPEGLPYFVEVKSEEDTVKDNQKIMHTFLKQLGVPVLISREGEWVVPTPKQWNDPYQKNIMEYPSLKKRIKPNFCSFFKKIYRQEYGRISLTRKARYILNNFLYNITEQLFNEICKLIDDYKNDNGHFSPHINFDIIKSILSNYKDKDEEINRLNNQISHKNVEIEKLTSKIRIVKKSIHEIFCLAEHHKKTLDI